MLLYDIPERGSDNLDSSGTTYPAIRTFEDLGNLVFPSQTKALRYQAAQRVAAGKRTNARTRLLESY